MAMFEANKLGWVAPLSDATNKLARVHQFTAVLSGSEHLGFWCWLMERGGERERDVDWLDSWWRWFCFKIVKQGEIGVLSLPCFQFCTNLWQTSIAMESGWLSEVLEIHEHEDAAKCSLTKKPNSSISFLFFWRHHLFMHMFFKQTSRSHGSLYRSFFQPSKYHRIGLENLRETPIFDGKNIKNHGFL